MVHPNTKIKSLISEFRHEFGDMSGSNIPLDALLLYNFLKTMTGASTPVTSPTSTSIASTVTVRGSTGATLLTNAQGALLIGSPLASESTLSSLNTKLPPLINNRLPVEVQFPSSQSVAVNNQISGFSTESTLSTLLGRIPQPITGRLPVNVQFPPTLATESTLSALNSKLPALVGDRLPVDVVFPPQQVDAQITGFSTEDTLLELVSRIPEPIRGNTPVTFDAQTIGLATEQSLAALLGRFPNQVNNRLPVGVQFPTNQQVTVSNPTSGFSTETTLSSLLARIPDQVGGRLPVGVAFPTDLAKDASILSNGQKLDQLVLNTAPTNHRVTITSSQYYSSKSGGQRSFNATAGIVSIGSTATLATLLINPVGSGVDIYIHRVVLASLAAGNFMRYRGGSYTIGASAVAAKSLNRSKGTTAAMGKVYGNTNVTVAGGDMGMVIFNAAHGSYPDDINGTVILPPGDFVYWMFVATGNNATQTAIEVVWWELPTT